MTDLTPEYLRSTEVWAALGEALTVINASNVDHPVELLERIRHLTQSSEPLVLNGTARMLGFDLGQDVLAMSANSLVKLVSQLPLYPDRNSTEAFSKFIDLLLNAVTEVRYLWTQDYLNFQEQPEGALVIDGGSWFKTTHIELDIALLRQTLLLEAQETLASRVKTLFYKFAPIALVIERLTFVLIFNNSDWQGGSAFGVSSRLHSTSVELRLE